VSAFLWDYEILLIIDIILMIILMSILKIIIIITITVTAQTLQALLLFKTVFSAVSAFLWDYEILKVALLTVINGTLLYVNFATAPCPIRVSPDDDGDDH
jgi:hypothetical protein